MKALVIDDDFETRESVKRMLEGTKVELISVADAISALLILKDNPDIKIVITDYRLPGLGGKDWISLIEHYHPQVRLVVITGYLIAKNNIADTTKLLIKPFSREQLLANIDLS